MGEEYRARDGKLGRDVAIKTLPRQRQRSVDLHPDGDRFAIAATDAAASTKQDEVVLISNSPTS